MTREKMRIADSAQPAFETGNSDPALGFCGNKRCERGWHSWQGAQVASLAPFAKCVEIAAVGAAGRGRFFGTGEFEGEG
jgi:hypothetical protein